MDILYRMERATAGEVLNNLSGEPHYSTVRTQLRVLEVKGYVRHEAEHLRFVYVPAIPQHEVGQSALKQLIETFYRGSTENAVAALLEFQGSRLSAKSLDRIAAMIAKAKKKIRR